jgi:subtilisin family serine protease
MKIKQNLARAGLLAILSVGSCLADDILVRVDPSVAGAVASRHGLRISKQLTSDRNLFVFSGPGGSGSAKVQELKTDSLVRGAEPNQKVGLEIRPNTARKHTNSANTCASTALLPAFADPRYSGQAAVKLTCAGSAQRQNGSGSGGIHVAVIDTAMDMNHPILKGVVDNGYDAIGNHVGPVGVQQETSPFVDQETSPFVDSAGNYVLNQETSPFVDQETSPFVDQETSPFVDSGKAFGHATMVAGIIHLVAPNVRIMPIRAFNNDGSADIADVVEGIRWAVDHGADVLNMSFSTTQNSTELTNAILYALGNKVVCVASVSNAHTTMPVYPAAIFGVIGVGATDQYDQAAVFSDYGMDVTIAAPGTYIWSTYPGGKRKPNTYARNDGTSFATPFVAGAAALLKSNNDKKSSVAYLIQLLQGADKAKGFLLPTVGRLNVLNAEK